jgi:hypothetical protein
MHRARVFLRRSVIVLLSVRIMKAIGVNRPYLAADARHERNGARDYDYYVFSHFVWL